MNIEDIARVCHESNAAFCRTLGDTTQLPWTAAAKWQRKSAIQGVEYALANPNAPVSAQHDSWLAAKAADGWKYGPVKDDQKKEHPCMVAYECLPIEQQKKDALFKAIVAALK